MTNPFSKIYLLAFFCLCSTFSFSQNPPWIWARQSEGNAYCIAGQGAIDADQNAYTCGFYIDSLKFGPKWAYSDAQEAFIVKYDRNGNYQWLLNFPTTGSSFTLRMEVDSQGKILLYGRFRGQLTAGSYTLTNNGSRDDYFLLKIDPNGTILWARQSNNNTSLDYFTDMEIDERDHIYLLGVQGGGSPIAGFPVDSAGFFLVEYDPAGTPVRLISESKIGGSAVELKNQHIYVLGSLFDTTVVGTDTIIPKGYYEYIPIGMGFDTVWTRYIHTVLLAFDQAGNPEWSRVVYSKQSPTWPLLVADDQSNLYFGGNAMDSLQFWGNPIYPGPGKVPYLAKVDSSGNFLWYKGGQSLAPNGVIELDDLVFENGALYALGLARSSTSFANVVINNNGTFMDLFILKIDTQGVGEWLMMDTTNLARNQARGFSVDDQENITIGGFFEDSVHFANDHLNAQGDSWPKAFLARASFTPLANDPGGAGEELLVFPNPSNGKFQLRGIPTGAHIRIFNNLGQKLTELKATGKSELSFELQGGAGMYFLQVEKGGMTWVRKLILQ